MSDVLPGVGGSCQQALTPMMGGGLGTCLAVGRLPAVFQSKGSVIQPINGWLDQMCKAKDCSSSDIQKAKKAIQQHCQAEAADPQNIISGLSLWLNNYGTVRLALCSEGLSGGWCVTNTLSAVQNTAHVTVDNAFVRSIIGGGGEANGPLQETVTSGALCNDCFANIMTKVQIVRGGTQGTISTEATKACGPDFLKINGTSTAAAGNPSGGAAGGGGSGGGGSGTTTLTPIPSSGAILGSIASDSIGLGAAVGVAGLAFSAYLL